MRVKSGPKGGFERAARKATAKKGLREPKEAAKADKLRSVQGLVAAPTDAVRAREKEAVTARMLQYLEGGYWPPELEGHKSEEPIEKLVEAWWALFDAPPRRCRTKRRRQSSTRSVGRPWSRARRRGDGGVCQGPAGKAEQLR